MCYADDISVIDDSEEDLVTLLNRMDKVDIFTYLGSRITRDGRRKVEVRSRTVQAKAAFDEKKNILTSKSNSL